MMYRRKLNSVKRRKRLVTIGERDGWICQLCHGEVDRLDSVNHKNNVGEHRASLDHINPLCLGGNDDNNNVRLAHQSCNNYIIGDNVEPYQPFDKTPLFGIDQE
jgi:hypothetical protein